MWFQFSFSWLWLQIRKLFSCLELLLTIFRFFPLFSVNWKNSLELAVHFHQLGPLIKNIVNKNLSLNGRVIFGDRGSHLEELKLRLTQSFIWECCYIWSNQWGYIINMSLWHLLSTQAQIGVIFISLLVLQTFPLALGII